LWRFGCQQGDGGSRTVGRGPAPDPLGDRAGDPFRSRAGGGAGVVPGPQEFRPGAPLPGVLYALRGSAQ